MAKVTSLLRLKADADAALIELVRLGKAKEIKQLIIRGVSTAELLMDLAKQGDTRSLMGFILAGADYVSATHTLQSNGEQDALNVLMVALLKTQSHSNLTRAKTEGLAHIINPSGSIDLI